MVARRGTQSDGYLGIASLLGWAFFLFSAALLKRERHIAESLTVALAGDALVAAVSGWTVWKKQQGSANHKNDMDLPLCSAALLLAVISLPVWLMDYLDRWSYAVLPILILGAVWTIRFLRTSIAD